MTRLALVRHGETIWNAENRYAGRTDIPLSPRGEKQSEQIAAWARTAGLAAIWVSPLRRARQTAAPAEVLTGITARVDSRLREIDFGRGEGLTNAEIGQRFPQAFAAFQRDPVAHPLPGGEDPREVSRRAMESFQEIEESHRGGRVLIVTHNTLIRVALCQWLGLPLSKYRSAFPAIGNGALSEILLQDGRASVLKLNAPLQPDISRSAENGQGETPL